MRLLAAILLAAALVVAGAGCGNDEKPREPVLTGELVAGGQYGGDHPGKVTVLTSGVEDIGLLTAAYPRVVAEKV